MQEVNHETIDAYCLCLPGTTVETPFGPNALVYKVCGKMFALLATDAASLNLKCEPTQAAELREQYEAVQPGYHMNKKHWNTIHWEQGGFTVRELTAWIDGSYHLVVAGLRVADRQALALRSDG